MSNDKLTQLVFGDSGRKSVIAVCVGVRLSVMHPKGCQRVMARLKNRHFCF